MTQVQINATLTPRVGMGATMGAGSDCYPYTIVWISDSGKTLRASQDHTKIVSGNFMNGNAVIEYTSREGTDGQTFRLNKRGQWKSHGSRLSIGERRYYQDPSF